MAQLERRRFLQTLGAGLAAAAAPARPNLLLVFADQLRLFSCGYAGDEHAHTPNLDRLASEGADFRQAVSSTPLCAPFRASLLTGKYQSSTGMVINELRLSPQHECFGHVLTRAGYRTAYIGKWHLWANELGRHDRTRNGFVPPGPYRLGFDGLWAAYNFNHQYFKAPFFRDKPVREFHPNYEPDSQTDMAIEFLRRSAAEQTPFALFLSWGPPHDPWDWNNVRADFADRFRDKKIPLRGNYSERPDPYADNWGRLPENYSQLVHRYQQVYYAQTASLDWNLGRLLGALDELRLRDNTIVVFTSDHGEMFGSHGRRAKLTFYEEAVRIPFLVRWPGRIPAGRVLEVCFSSVDIMPTLLGLMQLPIPGAVEGADLSAWALGRRGPEPEAAYMQAMGTTAAWQDGTEWRGLRDLRYTYAVYRRDGNEYLFDHRKDPLQLKNLAEERSHARLLRHYREKLRRWMKEHNDTFESCTWYRDHWTVDRNIVRTATGVTQDLEALQAILRQWFKETDS